METKCRVVGVVKGQLHCIAYYYKVRLNDLHCHFAHWRVFEQNCFS